MPKKVLVKDILDFINSFAPFNSAEDFDNVGLLVGNKNAEVKKVLVCLDCTDEIISEAIDLGANLVITHHPVIFSPLKKMVSDSIVYRLVQNSISVISAHTNLDIAPMGVADSLAEKMELKNIQPFALGNVESYYKLSVLGQEKAVLDVKTAFLPYISEYFEDNGSFCGYFSENILQDVLNISTSLDKNSQIKIDITKSEIKNRNKYYGRVGVLPKEMTAREFALYTKEKLGTSSLQFVNTAKKIKTAAIVGGSGGSFMFDAINSGADAFVTGDIKHNVWLDAKSFGLCLVDAGHFQTEIMIVPALKNILENHFGEGLFFASETEKSPFEFI